MVVFWNFLSTVCPCITFIPTLKQSLPLPCTANHIYSLQNIFMNHLDGCSTPLHGHHSAFIPFFFKEFSYKMVCRSRMWGVLNCSTGLGVFWPHSLIYIEYFEAVGVCWPGSSFTSLSRRVWTQRCRSFFEFMHGDISAIEHLMLYNIANHRIGGIWQYTLQIHTFHIYRLENDPPS